jgi:hypothetical protein
METAGGGRIVIICDNLQLSGHSAKIEANAKPLKATTSNSTLPGGSGGFIYIKTKDQLANSTFSPNSTIEVVGGYG